MQFLDALTALCLNFQEFCESTEHGVVFIKYICRYPHCVSSLSHWLSIPCHNSLSQLLLLFYSLFPLSQILIVIAVPLAMFLLLSCFNNTTASLECTLAMVTCDYLGVSRSPSHPAFVLPSLGRCSIAKDWKSATHSDCDFWPKQTCFQISAFYTSLTLIYFAGIV